MRARATLSIIPILFVLTACAEPPSKEMNQAQGAIDAARAAGAERYAAAELSAATDALKRSEAAVTERDYRLALSLAIDSRERAQEAAKAAVEARAKARGDAERVVAEVATLLTQASNRVTESAVAKLPRKVSENAEAVISKATEAMQEARTALAADDYARVMKVTDGLAAQLRAVLNATRPATTMSPARRRR
jgi:uncharacterized protein DUF4398